MISDSQRLDAPLARHRVQRGAGPGRRPGSGGREGRWRRPGGRRRGRRGRPPAGGGRVGRSAGAVGSSVMAVPSWHRARAGLWSWSAHRPNGPSPQPMWNTSAAAVTALKPDVGPDRRCRAGRSATPCSRGSGRRRAAPGTAAAAMWEAAKNAAEARMAHSRAGCGARRSAGRSRGRRSPRRAAPRWRRRRTPARSTSGSVARSVSGAAAAETSLTPMTLKSSQ